MYIKEKVGRVKSAGKGIFLHFLLKAHIFKSSRRQRFVASYPGCSSNGISVAFFKIKVQIGSRKVLKTFEQTLNDILTVPLNSMVS